MSCIHDNSFCSLCRVGTNDDSNSALDRSTEKNLSPPICIDLDRSSSSVDTFMDSDSEGGPIR